MRTLPPIKASQELDQLFAGSWKPGFLVRDHTIVAVKCKKCIITDDDAAPTVDTPRMMNVVTRNQLYAFRDGSTATEEAFRAGLARGTASRIAVWNTAEYVDLGWGIPLRAQENWYVFDISDDVQMRCQMLPCPSLTTEQQPPSTSVRCMYNGHVYDSKLEARHAVFFELLGVAYKPHPRAFATPWGSWTIDFLLTCQCYVEIKPTEPHAEEEMRCACACQQTSLPVVLLYGAIALPYTREERTDTYDRKQVGIRGWEYRNVNGAVHKSPVVWTERLAGQFTLSTVHVALMDLTWRTDSLLQAYETAAAWQGTE